jgi:hypothetical protein
MIDWMRGSSTPTAAATWRTVPDTLIGPSHATYFEWLGERYLAIAQSFCDEFPTCRCVGAQCSAADIPKATILQWDRVKREFGEMLAMTDEAEMRTRRRTHVPDESLYKHRYALRFGTGRARHVMFTTVRDKGTTMGGRDIPLLLFASGERGALAYEFDMIEVKGLKGASAVTASKTGLTGYAGSTPSSICLRPEMH